MKKQNRKRKKEISYHKKRGLCTSKKCYLQILGHSLFIRTCWLDWSVCKCNESEHFLWQKCSFLKCRVSLARNRFLVCRHWCAAFVDWPIWSTSSDKWLSLLNGEHGDSLSQFQIFIQDNPSVQSTVINGVLQIGFRPGVNFKEGGNRSARKKPSKSGWDRLKLNPHTTL